MAGTQKTKNRFEHIRAYVYALGGLGNGWTNEAQREAWQLLTEIGHQHNLLALKHSYTNCARCAELKAEGRAIAAREAGGQQ